MSVAAQTQDRPFAAATATRIGRRGLVVWAGKVLLLAVLPLSVVWYPVGRVPAAGNITLGDAALIALWALTAWELMVHGAADVSLRAMGIVVLAVAIGVLAGIGSEVTGAKSSAGFELSLHMKRFGLASILPVAALLFRSRNMAAWTRGVTLVTLGALAMFVLFPQLQAHVPRPESWDVEEVGSRAVGLVSNPNDLAYAAAGLGLLCAALTPRRPGMLGRAASAAALLACATCVVASASRSGLLGFAGAVAFLLLIPGLRLRTKLVLGLAAVALVAVGLTSSGAFKERVSRAYERGGSDESVGGRLWAQRAALRASLDHPFGVGFTGFASATRDGRVGTELAQQGTDNAYCEVLLASGALGLAAFAWLYRLAWKHVDRQARADRQRARLLAAALVAFLLFGMASIAPIAVSLSPIFFSIVGAAAYGDADVGGRP